MNRELFLETYVSPACQVMYINVEGVLCASGTHDPFTEDDSWGDLLEE